MGTAVSEILWYKQTKILLFLYKELGKTMTFLYFYLKTFEKQITHLFLINSSELSVYKHNILSHFNHFKRKILLI